MNIFTTYRSPQESAQALDDKRVIKMALESTQILSTAVYLNTNKIYENIYKPTHTKHPCVIWAANTRQNWLWLHEHAVALCSEYSYRYGKSHKCIKVLNHLKQYTQFIPEGKLEEFPNCTRALNYNIDYTREADVNKAYRKYLAAKWSHVDKNPCWTKRSKPQW